MLNRWFSFPTCAQKVPSVSIATVAIQLNNHSTLLFMYEECITFINSSLREFIDANLMWCLLHTHYIAYDSKCIFIVPIMKLTHNSFYNLFFIWNYSYLNKIVKYIKVLTSLSSDHLWNHLRWWRTHALVLLEEVCATIWLHYFTRQLISVPWEPKMFQLHLLAQANSRLGTGPAHRWKKKKKLQLILYTALIW